METNPYAAPQADVQDIRVVEGNIVLASRGSRLGATILDGVAAGVLIGIPGIFAGIYSSSDPGNDVPVIAGLVLAIGFLAYFAINCYLLYRNGQTIGKRALGIRIVRTDGSRAALSRIIFVRVLPFAIVGAFPYYRIGNLIALIDVLFIFRQSRQCLHDQLADTIVVEN